MSTRQRSAKWAPRSRWFHSLLLVFCAAAALSLASPASADPKHTPGAGGHPLRFLAYLVYPVGYALDQLLVRPAHWIVTRKSLAPLFGHKD